MLGDTKEHLRMTKVDLNWYLSGGVEADSIVVEWLENGEVQSGAYMSTHVKSDIELVSRAS